MLNTEEVKFDHRELEGAMKANRVNHQQMAEKIGISRVSFEKKLKGEVSFKDNEMLKIISILEIDASQIGRYFFAK